MVEGDASVVMMTGARSGASGAFVRTSLQEPLFKSLNAEVAEGAEECQKPVPRVLRVLRVNALPKPESERLGALVC